MLSIKKSQVYVTKLACRTHVGSFLLIEEYAQHGNLKTYLRSIRGPEYNEMSSVNDNSLADGLTESKMVQFALQVAKGMKYLMNKKVCELYRLQTNTHVDLLSGASSRFGSSKYSGV